MKSSRTFRAPAAAAEPAGFVWPSPPVTNTSRTTSAPMAKPSVHIALMVDVLPAFGRAICQGVSRFIQEHGGWSLFLYKGEVNAAAMHEWLRANHIDGIISSPPSRDLFLPLLESGIPLVNVIQRDRGVGVTSIMSDPAGIARMAAEFFTRSGFWNFAFCGHPGFVVSDLRETAFRDVLAALGHPLHTPPADDRPREITYEHVHEMETDRRLAEWLRELPKPVALLAYNDFRAQEIIRLAQEVGIDVPGQLAVLGVDNDEIVCNMCAPALSSIEIDAQEIGYAAAQALDGLLRGDVHPGVEVLVSPTRIVERQSTGLAPVENPVVSQALRLIRDRVRENMTTKALCEELNLSRTHLDKLFLQHLGYTPSEEIKRGRVKYVTELLQGTQLSLSEIAGRCGFNSTVCLGQFIRRETGMTPGTLRRKNQAEPGSIKR